MPVVTDFINELHDPEALLRHFYILIAGAGVGPAPPNGQAAVQRFRVDDRGMMAAGFTTGLSGLRGVTKQRPIVGVTLQGVPVGGPGVDEFDAYYIPMVQTTDVAANTSHYTLPTAGQPTIMITSQLSGCSFGVGSDAHGATLVTHIQPNQAVGQGLGKAGFDQRTADLANVINNSFHHRKGVFKLGDQYQARAAVIGQLKNGKWKFYLQATSGGQARTLTNTSKI
jgi:hypothetical protein